MLFGEPPPPQAAPPNAQVRAPSRPPPPTRWRAHPPVSVGQPVSVKPPSSNYAIVFTPPRRGSRKYLFGVIGALGLALSAFITIAVIMNSTGNDLGDDVSAALNSTRQSATITAPDDESQTVVGDAPEPFAFGTETTLTWNVAGDADRSRWNTTIGAPEDISDAILAENRFNEPPPDGVTYAGFSVDMSLVRARKQPLSAGFNLHWEIIGGSTDAVYDATTIETESSGCGVVPDKFDDFAEVFLGGSVHGTVCIPIPTEDVDHSDTRVSLNFGEHRIDFAADGAVVDPLPTPAPVTKFGVPSDVDRSGSRRAPLAYGVPATLRWATFGDADDSQWTTTIEAPADVTAAVLAENDLNDEPPRGTTFAGFTVELELTDAGKEPLSPGFNFRWEIVGGATAAVYTTGTVDTDSFGCGLVPDELDDYAEVVVGGTLTGTVCIPIPTVDLAHPNTRVALNFVDGARIYFGP